MLKFWLILLRIICIIQIILAVFNSVFSLIGLLMQGSFIYLLQSIAFAFIAALPVLAIQILGQNFPDKMIAGKQKRYFNRIFLINFLLITLLFAFVFRDYRDATSIAQMIDEPVYRLSFGFFIGLLFSLAMLVFHFCILYGLFWLRSHINYNAGRKQFDFEMQKEGI